MLEFYLSLIDTEEEKSKLEQIYVKYRKLMQYVANQILHDPNLAEDAVHNAFLKLTKYLHKIEDVDCQKTKSFIVIVSESRAKDMLAKRKREYMVSLDDEKIEAVTEVDFLKPFTENQIAERIDELPDIYREVLMLIYIHGYKESEIAGILNIKAAAVRKRHERAKKKLALLLGNEVNE